MSNENFAPKRSLRTQAVAVAGATGLAQIVMALLYLSAARGSSVEEFGSVVAAVAAGIGSVGLVDLGTNNLWTRELAAGRLTQADYSRRAKWKIVYILGASFVWAVTVALIFPGSPYWITGYVAFAQAFCLTVQAALRARGRVELVAAAVLVDKGVAAVVFVSFWLAGASALVALVVGITAGPITSAIVSNRLMLGDRRIRFGWSNPLNPWTGARNFGVANVAETARSYDVTLVDFTGGPAAAGTYGAVNRWTQAIELLSAAFISASVPYLANAPSTRAAIRHLRSGIWLPIMSLLASCAVIVLAPWIVQFLLGPEYADSADVLRLLAAGTIASNLNQPMYMLLMARGKDRSGAILVTVGIASTLTLTAVLTPGLGAIGAAIAYVAGHVLLFVMLVTSIARLLAAEKDAEKVLSTV
jgi:O-antigen/teichoic acid export membrane protein